MNTVQLTCLDGFFPFGSVTNKVLKRSLVPVWTVPPGEQND